MQRIMLGALLLLLFSAKAQWASAKAELAQSADQGTILDCDAPEKSGGQICYTSEGLGKPGESVAVFEVRRGQSDAWVGAATIKGVSKRGKRRGMLKIHVVESFQPVHSGHKVVNESGERNSALNWSQSFSKSGSSFAEDAPDAEAQTDF